jgi:hypothetical protein
MSILLMMAAAAASSTSDANWADAEVTRIESHIAVCRAAVNASMENDEPVYDALERYRAARNMSADDAVDMAKVCIVYRQAYTDALAYSLSVAKGDR